MSNVFIILGMHRTATSTTAHGLMSTGIHMGDRLLGPAPDNPKGFFEDVDFLILNERILEMAGGSWDNPPSEKEILKAAKHFETTIKALIHRKSERNTWGWKDPRTALTIKCYLPYLKGHQLFFTACFRDPQGIAKSLNKRNNMPIQKGIELANTYNKRILEFLNEWALKHPY